MYYAGRDVLKTTYFVLMQCSKGGVRSSGEAGNILSPLISKTHKIVNFYFIFIKSYLEYILTDSQTYFLSLSSQTIIIVKIKDFLRSPA